MISLRDYEIERDLAWEIVVAPSHKDNTIYDIF